MDKRLTKQFDKYNVEFFDGELLDCEVEYGVLPEDEKSKELGRTIVAEDEESGVVLCRIVLDESMKERWWEDKRRLLLHEMAHLRLYPYMGHGKKFYEEVTRLVIRGAYKGLL